MRLIATACSLLALTACTSTPALATFSPGDAHFNCQQINQSIRQTDAVMAEAQHNKGFNLANFFAWPGPVYAHNFDEADNAQEWAQRRRENLTYLYIEKGCAPDVGPNSMASSPTRALAERLVREANR